MVKAVETTLGPGQPDAFMRWRQALAPMQHVALPPGADPLAFSARGATYALPNAFLVAATASAQSLARTPSHIAARDLGTVEILLCTAGHVAGTHDGRPTAMGPGDLIVIDYRRPFAVRATEFSTRSLTIARTHVPTALQTGGFHGHVLPADTPAARLLTQQIESLFRLLPELGTDEAEAALAGILALAAAAWTRHAAPGPASSTARLRDRAITLMNEALHESRLTPDTIAARLGVSRGSLYAAFKGTGGIRASLLRLRLDAAARHLLDPAGPRSVSEVAFRTGFLSEAHFSRAFRTRFGHPARAMLSARVNPAASPRHTDWIDAKHRNADLEPVPFWSGQYVAQTSAEEG